MISTIISLGITLVILGALTGLFFFFRKKNIVLGETKAFKIAVKVAACVLVALMFARSYCNDRFVVIINKGYFEGRFYDNATPETNLLAILRWIQFASLCIIIPAVFYDNRIFRNMAKYFCAPFGVVNLFFLSKYLDDFNILAVSGVGKNKGFYVQPTIRTPFVIIEFVLFIIVPALLFFMESGKKYYSTKKEIILTCIYVPCAIALCPPVYLFQSVFGFTEKFMLLGTSSWFLWVLSILVLLAGIYFLFRFKDKTTRESVILMLALYTFMHYNTIYMMDLVASRLPLQLCNLGSYLILIACIFHNQKFFNFIFIGNVFGAVVATIIGYDSNELLSFWSMHYIIEHTWVINLPLLMVAFRLYEMPDFRKKALLHFFIGFTIFFVVCWSGGFVLNCFLFKQGHKFFNHVNYFYMYDNTVTNVFPFLGFTKAGSITINNYTFYPIYQAGIYIGYMALCIAFYFLIWFSQSVAERHFKLRQLRIGFLKEKGFYKKFHLEEPLLEYKKESEEK